MAVLAHNAAVTGDINKCSLLLLQGASNGLEWPLGHLNAQEKLIEGFFCRLVYLFIILIIHILHDHMHLCSGHAILSCAGSTGCNGVETWPTGQIHTSAPDMS